MEIIVQDLPKSIGTTVQLHSGWLLVVGTAFVLIISAMVLLRRHPGTSIPGPSTLPILQDDLFTLFSLNYEARRKWDKGRLDQYGNVFSCSFLFQRAVTVSGVDNVRRLLGGEHSLVEAVWPPSVRTISGEHAFTFLQGQQHVQAKRSLVRLFSAAAVRSYLPGIQSIVSRRLAAWADGPGCVKAGWQVKEVAFEVLLQLVMGVDVSHAESLVAPHTMGDLWRDITRGMLAVPLNLPYTGFGRAVRARHILGKFVTAILEAEEGQPSESTGPQSMVQLLKEARDENGHPLTMEEMQSNCILLMWTGHDTISTSMAVMLQQLALHPEVMRKLRAEQRQVVAAHGSELTEAVLRDMSYTEAVVREVLRYTPVVRAVPRVALQDFEVGGYKVKKGTNVIIDTYHPLRYAPEWVVGSEHDPDFFSPDRWLEPSAARAAWMPFGAGARMCIGYSLALAELKVFAAVLARGYEWELTEPQEVWSGFPLPTPTNGLPLAFRQSQQ